MSRHLKYFRYYVVRDYKITIKRARTSAGGTYTYWPLEALEFHTTEDYTNLDLLQNTASGGCPENTV
jgi:hypothetical protein